MRETQILRGLGNARAKQAAAAEAFKCGAAKLKCGGVPKLRDGAVLHLAQGISDIQPENQHPFMPLQDTPSVLPTSGPQPQIQTMQTDNTPIMQLKQSETQPQPAAVSPADWAKEEPGHDHTQYGPGGSAPMQGAPSQGGLAAGNLYDHSVAHPVGGPLADAANARNDNTLASMRQSIYAGGGIRASDFPPAQPGGKPGTVLDDSIKHTANGTPILPHAAGPTANDPGPVGAAGVAAVNASLPRNDFGREGRSVPEPIKFNPGAAAAPTPVAPAPTNQGSHSGILFAPPLPTTAPAPTVAAPTVAAPTVAAPTVAAPTVPAPANQGSHSGIRFAPPLPVDPAAAPTVAPAATPVTAQSNVAANGRVRYAPALNPKDRPIDTTPVLAPATPKAPIVHLPEAAPMESPLMRYIHGRSNSAPVSYQNTFGSHLYDKPGLRRGVAQLQGPGTSKSDSIPAMLSKGEAVLPAKTVQKIGPANIARLIQQTNDGIPPKGLKRGKVQHLAVGDPKVQPAQDDPNTMAGAMWVGGTQGTVSNNAPMFQRPEDKLKPVAAPAAPAAEKGAGRGAALKEGAKNLWANTGGKVVDKAVDLTKSPDERAAAKTAAANKPTSAENTTAAKAVAVENEKLTGKAPAAAPAAPKVTTNTLRPNTNISIGAQPTGPAVSTPAAPSVNAPNNFKGGAKNVTVNDPNFTGPIQPEVPPKEALTITQKGTAAADAAEAEKAAAEGMTRAQRLQSAGREFAATKVSPAVRSALKATAGNVVAGVSTVAAPTLSAMNIGYQPLHVPGVGSPETDKERFMSDPSVGNWSKFKQGAEDTMHIVAPWAGGTIGAGVGGAATSLMGGVPGAIAGGVTGAALGEVGARGVDALTGVEGGNTEAYRNWLAAHPHEAPAAAPAATEATTAGTNPESKLDTRPVEERLPMTNDVTKRVEAEVAARKAAAAAPTAAAPQLTREQEIAQNNRGLHGAMNTEQANEYYGKMNADLRQRLLGGNAPDGNFYAPFEEQRLRNVGASDVANIGASAERYKADTQAGWEKGRTQAQIDAEAMKIGGDAYMNPAAFLDENGHFRPGAMQAMTKQAAVAAPVQADGTKQDPIEFLRDTYAAQLAAIPPSGLGSSKAMHLREALGTFNTILAGNREKATQQLKAAQEATANQVKASDEQLKQELTTKDDKGTAIPDAEKIAEFKRGVEPAIAQMYKEAAPGDKEKWWNPQTKLPKELGELGPQERAKLIQAQRFKDRIQGSRDQWFGAIPSSGAVSNNLADYDLSKWKMKRSITGDRLEGPNGMRISLNDLKYKEFAHWLPFLDRIASQQNTEFVNETEK